ncbi:MAG: cation:proton antiporter [Armatimonadetes bacterium]|nr:cation:proton antiporter [Armatimonadota bacterium]
MSDLDMMLRFMLQVLVVLTTCRLLGWLGQKFLGQSQVTMEMIAGVVLGPSVFGALAPSTQQYLFPQSDGGTRHPSMTILYVVAQIGLILYMFVIGLELDLGLIRSRSRAALGVSLAGIILPFVLGCAVYFLFLENRTDMFGHQIQPSIAAIYVGAAMCITAFPMLARIIYEAGISGTPLGTLAIGAGASDDVAAWSLLAIVLAVSKGDVFIAAWAIGGGILFVAVALTLIRKLIAHLETLEDYEKGISQSTFGLVVLILFAGAWFTDAIGVYAVFGAFTIGVAMPKGQLAKAVQTRIEPLAVNLFLPFFFVFSGLNTKIGALTSGEHWLIVGAVLVAAIGGKLGGCYAAARLCREPHRQALMIGVLMNSRGLMELIILNIGLQQGVITQTFYTIMVVMAIVTTLMATPLFRRVYGKGFAIEPTTNLA